MTGSAGRRASKVLSLRAGAGIMPLITERNCQNTKVTQSSVTSKEWGVTVGSLLH